METQRRVHIVVEGLVQGVCFRYHTREVALSLGLTGWVKNLPDGCVEIVAEGESEKLERLIAWAKKGPASAKVIQAHARLLDALGEMAEFKIERV